MFTRCVENDTKKMAQRIINVKHPHDEEPIRRYEQNLTVREAMKPVMRFDRTTPATGPGVVGDVSFNGSAALTIIAEKSELMGCSHDISDLFEGVWKDEIISGSSTNIFVPNPDAETHPPMDQNCLKVLRGLFPTLFTRGNVLKPGEHATYISMFDASELLRKSLNVCSILLRESRECFEYIIFNYWAETYYQCSLLIFGEKGLTPYKLKLTLFPPLIRSGYIQNPWYHMCEGLEKSNHHAQKDFQTRTMRGGGQMHNQDPMFLELLFSYCKFLKLAGSKREDLAIIQKQAEEVVNGIQLEEVRSPTYTDICQKTSHASRIAVNELRERPLCGMRFLVVGLYTGEVAIQGKLRDPALTPHDMMEQWIRELGGMVYEKQAFLTLQRSYSRTPHCFIVLNDGKQLMLATTNPTTKPNDTDAESDASRIGTPAPNIRTKPKLSAAAKQCREFAGGNMTFLKHTYITASLKSNVVLDPYSDEYILLPGPNIKKIIVKDIRPLLLQQMIGLAPGQSKLVSAISALKNNRRASKQDNTNLLQT